MVNTTTITQGPDDIKARVKDQVSFPCVVAWDPTLELTVFWKKDNVDVRVDGRRITIDSYSNELVIRDLTFADAGKDIFLFVFSACGGIRTCSKLYQF